MHGFENFNPYVQGKFLKRTIFFSTKEVVLKIILGFHWKMFGFYRKFMVRLSKLHSMCAEAVFEGKQDFIKIYVIIMVI